MFHCRCCCIPFHSHPIPFSSSCSQNLDSLSYKELQAECKERKLKAGGKKAELKRRLQHFLRTQNGKHAALKKKVNARNKKKEEEEKKKAAKNAEKLETRLS